MENVKMIAPYGSLVRFKNYADQWLVEIIYIKEDKIYINKVPSHEINRSVVSYYDTSKITLDTRIESIIIDSVDDIEIINAFDAIKNGLIYYNQIIDLNDRVVCFYINRIGDKIDLALNTAKSTGQTVLLQYCTNNDQRFFIPVVKEDWPFDVKIRGQLYIKQLIY